MQVPNFATIADDFIQIVHTQVWCNAASIDAQNRPRSRVLHPIWENGAHTTTGWIATGRHSHKAKHFERVPFLSLCYMQDPLKPVYVECALAWVDDMAEKRRIWELLRDTPPPLGYDPAPFLGSVESEAYGLLKLTPWRIELADLFGQPRVWRAEG